MKKIKFIGWKKNMNKIKFIHLLNEQVGFSLKESKDIKDRIVNGEVVEIMVSEEKMNIIVSESIKFGICVEEKIN